MMHVMAIAAGGAIGAVIRHFTNAGIMAVYPVAFPSGIMAVNIIGSLLMGVLAGSFAVIAEPPQAIKLFLITGVLGGFTTFSAFSLDAVLLWQRGETTQAAVYVLGSVIFSILALVAGLWLARAVFA